MCCDRKLADNCDQDQLGQLRSRARQKSAQLLQALIINTCETLNMITSTYSSITYGSLLPVLSVAIAILESCSCVYADCTWNTLDARAIWG